MWAMVPIGESEAPARASADEVPDDGAPESSGHEPPVGLEHQETALPRRGLSRAVLKRLYYSWAFRTLLYGPLDLCERALGQRDPLTPPRRLQYVGRGDFSAHGAHLRDLLASEHGLTPETDVLDIGCGVGRFAVALTETMEGGSYRGFDIVPAGIGWCRREITSRHPRFEFELADVRNRQYNPRGSVTASEYEFPYPDRSFDLAVASSVFTHMRPDGTRRYLAEAARVLRPGGRLVCEFFLLDQAAQVALADGRTAFALDYEFKDASGTPFLGSDARLPEYNAALYEGDVREMAETAGLTVAGIEFGRWSGRPGGPQGRFQDSVTLDKPT